MSDTNLPENQPLPQNQLQMQAQTQAAEQTIRPLEYQRPPVDTPDQVFNDQNGIKPEWQYLLDSLKNLGLDALHDRQEKAKRILRDDGVTYNIYADSSNNNTQWELDLVPAIIGSEEWFKIESGLLERAELFNMILKDLYGPRQLIKDRIIPPEALYSHGGFLRSCQGIRIPGEHELILHSVDLIQRKDQTFCVLSDRTQAPSGSGYVLENRIVMSRVFPSLFRDSHVHRLASFFQRLRQKLISLSPSHNKARVVILTPGTQNETYFEHSYLSNYLGFPLVQSGDLVVRNGYVWMKSLDGLDRVDVILRRIDDIFCDPVELRSDSFLGIPGILSVIRAGRVVMVNPLGSGVLENPILLKYLPEISRSLLGREPRLDSVKTYWCGDPADFQYIKANLSSLIIKQIYRGAHQPSIWGGNLDQQGAETLLAKMTAKPYQFIAQERLEKGHIPTYCNGQLEARPAILRTFSVASKNSYIVMPGGLTRVGLATGIQPISMQHGCPSKDTWVTATEPERVEETPTETPLTDQETLLVSLPSRVVENLYWLGRYAERAEASLRMLRTVFMLTNAEQTISQDARKILLFAITEVTGTHPGFSQGDESMLTNPEPELLKIITDTERVGSVKSTLNALLYCADESKELLSSDTFRVINDIRDALDNLDAAFASGLVSAPEEALDPLIIPLIALSGLMQESMVRGVGWNFMDMGRRVERAIQIMKTVDTLITKVTDKYDHETLLNAMLRSMEVLITFRRHNRNRDGLELGLELVMLDETNPRSLMFQFEQLQRHFSSLRRGQRFSRELANEDRVLLEAITSLKLSRIKILVEDHDGERKALTELLAKLNLLLSDFSNIVSDKYFEHRIDSQQLVNSSWSE